MKKLLAVVLAALLLISVTACGNDDSEQSDGVSNYAENTTYEVRTPEGESVGTLTYRAQGSDYAIITKYTPETTDPHSVYIPEVVGTSVERTVTGIDTEAFKACSSITSVSIPATVETIGAWAFDSCTLLYSISIPKSVKSIGKGAFASCASLIEVNFAEDGALTELGNFCFYNCDSLKTLSIPEGIETVREATFMNSKSLQRVTLPSTIKTVERAAFAECDSIKKITLGNNIEALGDYAFGTLLTDGRGETILSYESGSVTDTTLGLSKK